MPPSTRLAKGKSTPSRSPPSTASSAADTTLNFTMPRFNTIRNPPSSSSGPTDELWYLDPCIIPTKLTVNQLRGILLKHRMDYKTSAKKAELVGLFEKEVLGNEHVKTVENGETVKNGKTTIDSKTDKNGKTNKTSRTAKNDASNPDVPAQQPRSAIDNLVAIVKDSLLLLQDVCTLVYHHPKLSFLLFILWVLYIKNVWNAWRFGCHHPKLSVFIFVAWLVYKWW